MPHAPGERKNVLLIVVDQWRGQCLSFPGPPCPPAPGPPPSGPALKSLPENETAWPGVRCPPWARLIPSSVLPGSATAR